MATIFKTAALFQLTRITNILGKLPVKEARSKAPQLHFIPPQLVERPKILEMKIMRGPNIWSNYHKKLIVMKVDLGELENYPTDKISGFAERLETMIPSLYEHRCSEDHKGGFFKRVRQGTWMGHVIEHIALELQSLAGMDCGFGRTRSSKVKGVYHVVFSYVEERAGKYAGAAAVRIAAALIHSEPYDLEYDIQHLKRINAEDGLGPSTQSIINEAKERGIPAKRIENSEIILGQGINQQKICASIAGTTGNLAVEIAGDKEETKKRLQKAHIPVPQGKIVRKKTDIEDAIDELGFPVVIKPVDGNHGRGVTVNIKNFTQARAAFKLAKEISKRVIIEQFVEGDDHRFLVVNYQLVAVAKRLPAMICGDGKSTIQELINEVNCDPNRGEGHEKNLTKIHVDEATLSILESKKLHLHSILKSGEKLALKETANLSTGGTAEDVTDRVHPFNKLMAERIAEIIGLNICGIDMVVQDITSPINSKTGAVIEVNACPGLRMHLAPSHGQVRNVAKPIVDMLFPNDRSSRIPVVAITGTNGKTTTTRLIAHLAKCAGHRVGYTTTDGIYVRDTLIHAGDCTGPISAETVLMERGIDFAVLECARGGILRSGLGFDHCDISVITNITEDHLGLQEIDTLSEMANVKAVVARSTFDHGYSILNADDPYVMKISSELDSNIALFSTKADNMDILEHCKNGGLACYLENGFIMLSNNGMKTKIDRVEDIPITLGGKAECMIKNIFPAVLTAAIRGISTDVLRNALQTFVLSPETTPGRFNIFDMGNYKVMVDYAHNAAGLRELEIFMDKIAAELKIGIIGGTGDRREEDLRTMGRFAAKIFKKIIIKNDRDLRGNTRENINHLVVEGIRQENRRVDVVIIPQELKALKYAMDNAIPGSFITILADDIQEVIHFLQQYKAQNSRETLAKSPERKMQPESAK
jgi:cyanophycin synthetase